LRRACCAPRPAKGSHSRDGPRGLPLSHLVPSPLARGASVFERVLASTHMSIDPVPRQRHRGMDIVWLEIKATRGVMVFRVPRNWSAPHPVTVLRDMNFFTSSTLWGSIRWEWTSFVCISWPVGKWRNDFAPSATAGLRRSTTRIFPSHFSSAAALRLALGRTSRTVPTVIVLAGEHGNRRTERHAMIDPGVPMLVEPRACVILNSRNPDSRISG
jgi:hypothetical protein